MLEGLPGRVGGFGLSKSGILGILIATLASPTWAGITQSTQKSSSTQYSNTKKVLPKKIFKYIEKGNLAEVKKIVNSEIQFDLDSTDDFGLTPLMVASCYNHLEMIKFLLSKGADPNKEYQKKFLSITSRSNAQVKKSTHSWCTHNWPDGWTAAKHVFQNKDYTNVHYGMETIIVFIDSKKRLSIQWDRVDLHTLLSNSVSYNNSAEKILEFIINSARETDQTLNLDNHIFYISHSAKTNLLGHAVYSNRSEIIKILLNAGVNPHYEVPEGYSALEAAVLFAPDKLGTLSLILKHGKSEWTQNSIFCVLAFAIKEKNDQMIEMLLAHLKSRNQLPNFNEIFSSQKYVNDIHARAILGPTAPSHPYNLSMLAILHSNERALQLLLEAGADPNDKLPYEGPYKGMTLIEYAFVSGKTNMPKILLEYGKKALVGFKSADVSNQFVETVKGGDLALVEWWLQNISGLNINGRDKQTGSTAVYIAAKNKNAAVVKLLLEKGANPDLPSLSEKKTATELLEAEQEGNFLEAEQEGDLRRVYIEYKTAKVLRSPEKLKALTPTEVIRLYFELAKFGNTDLMSDILREMYRLDLNFDQRNANGYTALMIAAKNGRLAVVKLLLDKGVNPSLCLPDSTDTAMHLAFQAGHHDVVNELSKLEETKVNSGSK